MVAPMAATIQNFFGAEASVFLFVPTQPEGLIGLPCPHSFYSYKSCQAPCSTLGGCTPEDRMSSSLLQV